MNKPLRFSDIVHSHIHPTSHLRKNPTGTEPALKNVKIMNRKIFQLVNFGVQNDRETTARA